MKICHLTSVHKDNDVRIVLKEINSLSKKYDTTFLVNDPSNNKTQSFIVKDLGLKYKSRLKRLLFSKNIILQKALEVDADLYHFHDPELLPVGNKLVKANKKVIYDVHEDTPKQILSKYYIPRLLRKPISFIFSRYEKKSAKSYTSIVTATPHLKSKFKLLNTNTIDVNNYPILNEFINLNNYVKYKPLQVAYVGGLTEERGIYTMINLANHFSHVKFAFCGDFSNSLDEEKAKSMIKHDNIEFLGFVSRDKIKEVLEESTIGLVLLEKNERYKDSLPIKMFEYMAAGIPVVATDFKLWQSILYEAKAGKTVNPENFSEIIKKLTEIFDDADLAQSMGNNGRKFVIRKYNWENEEKKLINLYSKIEENKL